MYQKMPISENGCTKKSIQIRNEIKKISFPGKDVTRPISVKVGMSRCQRQASGHQVPSSFFTTFLQATQSQFRRKLLFWNYLRQKVWSWNRDDKNDLQFANQSGHVNTHEFYDRLRNYNAHKNELSSIIIKVA